MKNLKTIFIPGNGGGSPKDNWFPYLKTELEKLGVTVLASEFTDNKLAREKYWIPFLKNELKADETSILIGHSTGAIAAMRYAEKYKIAGSVLVATYYTDLNNETEKASGYFDRSWDWNAIKNNQQWIIEFASTDDPWIPINEPRFIHEKLNTEYYEFTDQGHFGFPEKKAEFPQLLDALKKKLV